MLIDGSQHDPMRGRALIPLCAAAFAIAIAPGIAVAQIQVSGREGCLTPQAAFDPSLGLALLPVTIGGTRAECILVTMSPGLVVDRSLQDLLEPLRPAGGERTPHDDHQEELFRVRGPLLILGQAAKVGPVRCTDYSVMSAVLGRRIDGAIGMDSLRDHVVRIDSDRGTCALLEDVPDDPGTPVPIHYVSGLPVVDVALDGVGVVSFSIDTATSGTHAGLLDQSIAARLAARGMARRVGTSYSIDGDHRKWGETNFRVARMTLGPFSHEKIVFSADRANVLGFSYLSRYMVTFDFPGKTLYLKAGSRFNEPSLHDLSGAHIYRPDRKTRVHSVDKRSASDVAGLKADDVLDSIDGCRAASLTTLQIRKKLCVTGEHTLRITRSKRPIVVSLTLKTAK